MFLQGLARRPTYRTLHRFRALGWYLLSSKGKAEMDATQWEQDATEKQQKIAELEQEFNKAQEDLQQQISSAKVICISCEQSAGSMDCVHNPGSMAVPRHPGT